MLIFKFNMESVDQGVCKYDHYCIEGPCQCQWIWLDARKTSLCLHVNPRKPRESNFQTGFRPIRFLNCIGVHKILNILKCKHGWAHEYFFYYGWNYLNRSILCNTSVVSIENTQPWSYSGGVQIRPLLYWGSLPVSVNMVGCWKIVTLFTCEPEKAVL